MEDGGDGDGDGDGDCRDSFSFFTPTDSSLYYLDLASRASDYIYRYEPLVMFFFLEDRRRSFRAPSFGSLKKNKKDRRSKRSNPRHASTSSVKNQQTLETSTVIRKLADPIQAKVDDFFPNGIESKFKKWNGSKATEKVHEVV
ncbi:uncharacterized protein LOC122074348 [Macadamia integrifolia]|uniref:uncharacterized protein LOC122074348 n=1 Tax=Macadamia integrifolia TaxID=60698 RepID=UPI001C4EDEC5|nr:uncharacterized protein LOC122074348 [Macadamia integrifolia]